MLLQLGEYKQSLFKLWHNPRNGYNPKIFHLAYKAKHGAKRWKSNWNLNS